MLWENIISKDFPAAVEASKGLCVVPIGCLEKHGPHSPLGTDTIIASETAIRAAQIEPVVVFPTMYFGDKCGAGEFPGTVIFSLETRWHIFRETCNEIYRNGFKKILFVNGHGGNVGMLSAFTRAMMRENPNIMLYTSATGKKRGRYDCYSAIADDYTIDYLTEEDRQSLRDFVAQEKRTGHACIGETARTYYYRPETVRLDRIQEESGESTHLFDSFNDLGISTHFAWMANYPNSYQAANDYVLNDRIAKAISEYLIDDMVEIFKFLKEEHISDDYHAQWLTKQ